MLLPRYSIRLMLLITTGCALVFLIARLSMGGSAWAIGVLMSVLAALLLLGIFGLMFMTAYSLSVISNWRRPPLAESPFADDKLPPQIIPPSHVDD